MSPAGPRERKRPIEHAFDVDEWTVRERGLSLEHLARSESVFALSNGHIGLRGNLDEGEPAGLPGTYLGGFYEKRPLPYAEPGYGFPEAGQTVINATNGKLIRLLVIDEPFDVRYGELHEHERVLDMRAGTLTREVVWTSRTGRAVRVRSVRMVSFAQRAVAAISFEVEPLDGHTRLVLQSELVANEALPGAKSDDPRVSAALAHPLVCKHTSAHELRASMVHVTNESKLWMAAAMDHEIDGPPGTEASSECEEDLGRVTITADGAPVEPIRLTKFIAYGWSSRRSPPALRDQVEGALAEARSTGWDGMLALQRSYLDEVWERADVEIGGDTSLQQAVRFGIFHTVQAGARAEGRGIPAKGLTGSGYDGHAFWDSEIFALPLLTYSTPDAAAAALRWRHTTLPKARERAQQLNLRGAAFPWRTIRGEECSGYWPAGTAAFHVNADVAYATIQYLAACDDEAFERKFGLELLVETARLWRSLGHHDAEGHFRIDGVTGPDEYTAIVDNNVYTNLMAQLNLREACKLVERHPQRAEELGVDPEEAASWRDAAEAMVVPYDEALQVHSQPEGFTSHQRWDFEGTPVDKYPLLLNYPYFDLYRKQVVKQADLVLAMHLRGDYFDLEQKRRNFVYYEPLTVRDSSLSACTQAVMAAEVGFMDLAYDHFTEAARVDLDDLFHNTNAGLHIASLAGAWMAAVAGFGGFRDFGGELSFAPRLPEALSRLAYRLFFRGRRISIDVGPRHAVYSLLDGEPLDVTHHGETITLAEHSPVTRPIPETHPGEAPPPPPGRRPSPAGPDGRPTTEAEHPLSSTVDHPVPGAFRR